MPLNTFNLPDVGEGLTEAEIVRWFVAPGATVAVNDVIVEIETAKSLVELPSPYAGVVAELHVQEGETVEVGTAIISVSDSPVGAGASTDDSGGGAENAPPTAEHVPGELVTPPRQEAAPSSPEDGTPLVGTGPKADSSSRRPRTDRPVRTETTTTTAASTDRQPTDAPAGRASVPSSGATRRALAKPPVRKAARDLGIDLADVPATGGSGEVTKQDLLSYQGQRDAEQDSAPSFWGAATRPQDERIERVPVKGVRKATARAMVESAFSAPHVSIFVDVDASRTMEFVKRLKSSRDFEGIKISPLLILAKAVIWAVARNPSVNATWTDQEILIKHYMNLGIAAATPRGLMVPNIKDAQDLSLKELAVALNDLATRARAGKTPPSEMQGGTLTVTNIGALGIDTGTPIINPGEVAIVAFGTIKQKPWVLDGEVIPRWITTLGGSFDHRVVDGDLSARFMADVASILEEPALLLD